jgi:uncharacterized membrane protein YoaK (UPF0700 family)
MRQVRFRRLHHAIRALERAVVRDEYAQRVSVGWSGPSDPPRRTLPLILLMLTFTTGVVDAVSYLGLARVFTGFQTGNIIVLGFAATGTEGFTLGPPAISLGCFFVGAALGGRLAAALSERHRRWFALALTAEALLVAAAAAIAATVVHDTVADGPYLVIVLLALAMGIRSATIRRLSAPGVTTTVLTSTITALAADVGASGLGFTQRVWQVATIASLLLGAVAGAVLVRLSLFTPLLLVAAVVGLSALAYVMPVVVRAWRRRLPIR